MTLIPGWRRRESALGITDISGMTKAQAVEALGPSLNVSSLTPREAVAVQLVDRLVTDPHSVDEDFYQRLRQQFSEEEIIELVVASSLFTLAGSFNTVVRLDTDRGGKHKGELAYATSPPEHRASAG